MYASRAARGSMCLFADVFVVWSGCTSDACDGETGDGSVVFCTDGSVTFGSSGGASLAASLSCGVTGLFFLRSSVSAEASFACGNVRGSVEGGGASSNVAAITFTGFLAGGGEGNDSDHTSNICASSDTLPISQPRQRLPADAVVWKVKGEAARNVCVISHHRPKK